MHGFGPVDRRESGYFPQDWERKVFALTLASGLLGKWNLDQSRFARETMDPGHYLTSTYYEHWLHGLETLLVETGLILPSELEQGQCEGSAACDAVTPSQLDPLLQAGSPTVLDCEAPPVYAVGQTVKVGHFHPKSHTRAPRYIRGHIGIVEKVYGAHIFPDEHARSAQKVPAYLYSVRFDAAALWGKSDPDKGHAVFVDVFEPYLEKGFV